MKRKAKVEGDNTPFDLLIFIGRFQPFHYGHKTVIDTALEISNKLLILVGSENDHRNIRNPFSAEARINMIAGNYEGPDRDKLEFRGLPDFLYNETLWIKTVQERVKEIIPDQTGKRIGLIGHNKDDSSYYLKLFPMWESVDVEAYFDEINYLASTDVREELFKYPFESLMSVQQFKNILPPNVINYLRNWAKSEDYDILCKEWEYVNKYKRDWENAPFPPTFVTVDAVVIQTGHVLLIERGDYPGKGQWALPGGFINEYEAIDDATIRELTEETKIDVPTAILKAKLENTTPFSHPYRSTRGRTITFASLIDLDSEIAKKSAKRAGGRPIGMTKVKGSDDAVNAKWVPIADLRKRDLFEDHYEIIQHMIEAKDD